MVPFIYTGFKPAFVIIGYKSGNNNQIGSCLTTEEQHLVVMVV